MKILLFCTIIILIFVSPVVGLWGIFKKAGEKPWKALIPLFNIVVLLGIIKKPKWYIILLIIPAISTIFVYYLASNVYKQFGKRSFWWQLMGCIGLIIFVPFIGLSKRFVLIHHDAPSDKNSELKDWFRALLLTICVALFLKGLNIFLFQNYRLPTSAMEKTLLVGDHFYVSKWSVGPRLPVTPLAFPFWTNEIPFLHIKSYSSSVQLPYIRLGKLNVKRNDIITFNFPEGDTVALENTAASYYAIIRETARELKIMDQRAGNELRTDKEYYDLGRQEIWNRSKILTYPLDRRDNYIKRCVAIPGDTLQIVAGQVYINGKFEDHFEDRQFHYLIKTDGSPINPNVFEKLGICYSANPQEQNDIRMIGNGEYDIPLTEKAAQALRSLANVKLVERVINSDPYGYLFPHNLKYPWKQDDFGPLWMPQKGITVKITMDNLCLYERIINAYEGNKLDVRDSIIFINDKPATSYTFKMNYFFVLGDNRHGSSDSRYWGFVPEDHITGSLKFIVFSLDPNQSFPSNIRWKRMFASAK